MGDSSLEPVWENFALRFYQNFHYFETPSLGWQLCGKQQQMPSKRQTLDTFLDSDRCVRVLFFYFLHSILIFIFTLNKRINQDGLHTFAYIFVGGWTLLLTCLCFTYTLAQPPKMLNPPGLFLFILKICLASSLKNDVFLKCKVMLRQVEVASLQKKNCEVRKVSLDIFFPYVCHLTLEIFEDVVILSYKESFVQTSQLVK